MESQARVGDEISVESHRLTGARRVGEIVEVLGSPEHEYYVVRWQDGRQSVFHPGPDAVLVPKGRRAKGAAPEAEKPKPKRRPGKRTPEAEPKAGARRAGLRANVGDRLVIRGHHLGEPERDARIVEVLGEEGGPPYRVRWSDSGREALLFPGPDALIEHFPRRRRSRPE